MPDNDTSAPTRPTLTQRRATAGAHPITRITQVHHLQPEEPAEVMQPEPEEPVEQAPVQRNVMDRANLERPMVGRSNISTVNRSAAPILGRPVGSNGGGQPPLNTNGQLGANQAEGDKSSPIKVVVWVIIAIALAVACYFALRNAFPATTDNSAKVTKTVEPTVIPTPSIIGDQIVPDADATNLREPVAYNLNKQTVGTASTATFSIDTLAGTKYQTVTRFEFGVTRLTGPDTALTPVVTATYDAATKMIKLNFTNTTTLDAEGMLAQDEQVTVGTGAINLLARGAAALPADDLYTIALKVEAKYVLQLVTTGDRPTIILDVKEPAVTPTVTLPATTTTPAVSGTPLATATPTPSPTSTGSDILTNDFSTAAQELHNGLASNTADMIGSYHFNNPAFAGTFTYDKELSFGSGGLYPNVTGKIESGKVIVTVSNLVNKNVTPQTLPFAGVKQVTSLLATRSGNSLTYEFTLGTGTQYRILFVKDVNNVDALRIQVK